MGASAGGLEAFRQLLAHVPADAGLAFVLVQHLEPTRASLLSDALAQSTTMAVAQAEDGDRVERNRVYVIPPGTQLAIERGILRLAPLDDEARRPHLPIDFFLRSLAADQGRLAIGVVLSGSASDGTAGLGEIRAHGGIAFAQEPGTARFAEMPASAVAAGVVDFCLPLPALGAALARLARHPYLDRAGLVPPTPAAAGSLAEVISVLQAVTGVDFGEHKPDTFRRRLARRMAVRQVDDLADYLALLRRDAAEVRSLHDDLLIQVTSFFRDEASLVELQATALPEILRHKPPGTPIRAWVVGCATGEEVYSLAISIIEHLGSSAPAHPVLIFGSDLSERALQHARAGVYPDAAVRALGEERLKRFFVRSERGWRVTRAVRDLCVFVRHDVARDPPFSRLDLLSCRNVLIYFGQALQRRVLATAHYCLNQPGYLLLGRSESATGVARWFTATSRGGRVFLRKPGPSAIRLAPRAGAFPLAGAPSAADGQAKPGSEGALARQIDELVVAHFGPPGVVVTDQLEVIQFRGQTGDFLELPPGVPRTQLLELLRPGLAAPVRAVVARARKTSAPARQERATVGGRGGPTFDLTAIPLRAAELGERGFLVLFEARAPPAGRSRAGARRGRAGRLSPAGRRALEAELATAQEFVAVLLEEHGRASGALATANDELVSGNEELQSLNEELETAKEELQASNEELTTLNDELNGRNAELQAVNADVLNLLDAVEIPVLMLDRERRLRRYTSRAAALMRLGPGDVGRTFAELDLPVQAPDLGPWIARAMTEGILVEAEVQDRADRWHRLQVRPHRAIDGRTDGAILSLVDIHDLKHQVVDARWAETYARRIVEAVPVPLVVLDAALRVVSSNAAYQHRYQEPLDEAAGHPFFRLTAGAWDTAALRRAVAGLADGAGRFRALEIERELAGQGRRLVSVSGCAIASPEGAPLVLLALEDVTRRREVERRGAEVLRLAEAARQQAEQDARAKDLFLASLSHELRSPLTAILLQAELLQRGRLDAAGVAHAGAVVEACTRRQVRLVEDLLDVSRIVAGKLGLALEPLEWRELVAGVLEPARAEAAARSVGLVEQVEGPPIACTGDRDRLQQVVSNLVANALKFTPAGGRVEVRVDAVDGAARLVVEDTGRGIEAAFLPHVFDRFSQASRGTGLGLGLAIARELVSLHGGTVRAESAGPGLGATFTLELPLGGPAAPPPDEKGPTP